MYKKTLILLFVCLGMVQGFAFSFSETTTYKDNSHILSDFKKVNSGTKNYTKKYNSQGVLIAEGWQMGVKKNGYWKFYHLNGKLASKGHFKDNNRTGYWYFYTEKNKLFKEGHFVHGLAEKWWIFYDDSKGEMNKFQYRNNKKNGFALKYRKKKLVMAEKYVDDKKQGEWTSIKEFRRDNPGVSLR